MKQVGVYQAKTHLPSLLDEVERGETVIITRHGRPIARLVPVAGERKMTVQEAIEAGKESRKKYSLGGLSIRELIDEGRKY